MPQHARITIRFMNGESHVLTVNYNPATGKPDVKITGDSPATAVAHFGRDDGNGWYELLAAPLANIQSWGRFT